MLCKCHWIVLYIVHVTAFCLGGGVFFRTRCRYSKPLLQNPHLDKHWFRETETIRYGVCVLQLADSSAPLAQWGTRSQTWSTLTHCWLGTQSHSFGPQSAPPMSPTNTYRPNAKRAAKLSNNHGCVKPKFNYFDHGVLDIIIIIVCIFVLLPLGEFKMNIEPGETT